LGLEGHPEICERANRSFRRVTLPFSNFSAMDVQIKTEIYHSLYIINQSLQLVTEHLEELKLADVLTPDFAEIRRLAAEQMRCEINQMATSRLHDRECDDAHHFEQQRMTQEERLRVPGPVQSSTSSQNHPPLRSKPKPSLTK
jgi:hypothetical protein